MTRAKQMTEEKAEAANYKAEADYKKALWNANTICERDHAEAEAKYEEALEKARTDYDEAVETRDESQEADHD